MKLNHPLLNKTIALIAQGVVRGWMSTLDYKAALYDPSIDPASPDCRVRGIYIFWHEYIPLLMYLRGNCDLAMLMSRHRDADILSRLSLHFGFDFVRGSTRRGGDGALREMIHKLHDLKISFSFNLIFGWDTDRKEDFEQTINFLQENKVHAAFFNSFAPHKGTRIYDIFLSEGRILDPENMNRWPGVYAKIHPKHMTPEELEAGIKSMYKTFYSWPYIIRRLPLPLSESALASWSVNLSQRKFAFGEGTNFDNY